MEIGLPADEPLDYRTLHQYFCVDIRDRLDLTELADLFGKAFAREQMRDTIGHLLDESPRVQVTAEERDRLVEEILDATRGLGPEDPDEGGPEAGPRLRVWPGPDDE